MSEKPLPVPDKTHILRPYALILACALAAIGWQLLHPGYYCIWKNDVAYTHKYILQFTESFRQGILYPRWMAECFGGYGSPVFVYYSPSLYYLAGIAGLAGVGPDFSTIFLPALIALCGRRIPILPPGQAIWTEGRAHRGGRLLPHPDQVPFSLLYQYLCRAICRSADALNAAFYMASY